ncbi:MAG: alanine racemase [Melioribacteraceae bacterium]|nr:alanine racemase [Melioribacteraceae bacterium]
MKKVFHSSKIEISKSALKKNYDFIRNLLPNKVKFSSVIKGNAYGHSIDNFVPLAEELGVDHFSVFSADEAWQVFDVCDTCSDVMIMGNIDNEELSWAVENEIEFYVFELDRLEAAIKVAKQKKQKAKVHLEVETGMNRTGFETSELKSALKLIDQNKEYVSFEGLCTHYAGAESIANYVRIQEQFKRFNRYRKAIEKEGFRPKRYHTACSAAAISYPKTRMDMVRIGILQYGFWPSRETNIHYFKETGNPDQPIERILSWKSKIMDVKKVKTGEFIGYGTTYLAQRDMKIATIPVGYSHGFARGLSNIGRVLVNEQRVGVIGMVSMNLMTIDVTGCNKVTKGDEVVIIGKQGELELSVSSFSELSSQVNYETLTRLPENITREIVD